MKTKIQGLQRLSSSLAAMQQGRVRGLGPVPWTLNRLHTPSPCFSFSFPLSAASPGQPGAGQSPSQANSPPGLLIGCAISFYVTVAKHLAKHLRRKKGYWRVWKVWKRKSGSCPGRSSVTCHHGRPWSREKRWMPAPPILLNSFSLAEFCAEAASFGAGLTLGTLSYSLHTVSILHFLL